MKFDPNKPVQTRIGQPARIISTTAKGNYPIVALVTVNQGCSETPHTYTAEGVRYIGSNDPLDLVNVPPPRTKITRYVNIYRRTGEPYVVVSSGRATPELAQTCARNSGRLSNYIAIAVPVEIEYTEGQGIDE